MSYDLYLVSHVLCVSSCNYVLCVLRTWCWLVNRLHWVAGPPRLKADCRASKYDMRTFQLLALQYCIARSQKVQHGMLRGLINWCLCASQLIKLDRIHLSEQDHALYECLCRYAICSTTVDYWTTLRRRDDQFVCFSFRPFCPNSQLHH